MSEEYLDKEPFFHIPVGMRDHAPVRTHLLIKNGWVTQGKVELF